MENKMDPKIAMISANGAKFGNEMVKNKELMARLLAPKNLAFKAEDLKACAKLFSTLDEVKKNAQMSKD